MDEPDVCPYEKLQQISPKKRNDYTNIYNSHKEMKYEITSSNKLHKDHTIHEEMKSIDKQHTYKNNPLNEHNAEYTNVCNIQKEDIKIKKNSIDFDTLNESIFNINIEIREKDIAEKSSSKYAIPEEGSEIEFTYENMEEMGRGENMDQDDINVKEEEKHGVYEKNKKMGEKFKRDNLITVKRLKKNDTKEKKRKKLKRSMSTNDNEQNFSDEFLDDVNEILQTRTNERMEKKNKTIYILQHRQRIKQKKDEKKNRKNHNYKPNLKNNFLNISKTTKDNAKRASVATVMLENMTNTDPDSDISSENSDGSNHRDNNTNPHKANISDYSTKLSSHIY
ncbi:hypothetical protein, conserved [Plasmodium gonderi]|uniref:Uncharacterized protein n=1 Tax=Plasmodium gonderi TaxID=77519 RepID=A0A1Y1JHR8_PLAGO|nr:hypothetical protein, conserved [Plasmodium gonderi]GAW81198.1 hypothetical protein, conserved [Plasmodium gonderi]